MFDRFRHIFLTPRVWLAAGVFSFGASIVLGYHQDQMAAQNVLTEKVDLPEQVLIQDFDPGLHSNILHEVKFLAEAGLKEIVTFNIGTKESPKWIQGTPIYPVGEVSRPFAESYIAKGKGEPRHPMMRSKRVDLAAETARIRPLQDQPMGIVLIEVGRSVEELGLLDSLGDGRNGPLVSTTGSLLRSDVIRGLAIDALSERGVEALADIPLIVPYVNGVRIAGKIDDFSGTRQVLDWLAVGFFLVGICNAFSLFSRPSKKNKPTAAFESVQAVGAFPSVFQPIRAQEDIIREEQEKSEQEASASRRRLSRINYPAA